jgi:hypothetical protein
MVPPQQLHSAVYPGRKWWGDPQPPAEAAFGVGTHHDPMEQAGVMVGVGKGVIVLVLYCLTYIA